MTVKKSHHIIPKVYQKEFVDLSKPKDFPENKAFTPFIWQIDKALELESVPKSPGKSFTKNRFYKLDDDADEFQVIEEFLNKIETKYKNSLERLKGKTPLNEQDFINLILFVETLHQRTESTIEHWQTQFSKIEDIYREVDQHHNNNQKYSDEFWKDSHEIGKRLIISGIGAAGKLLIDEGIYFLFNESKMPFVTSDQPVLWAFKHIDELQKLYIPNEWLRDEVKNNQKSFFCYCPLTTKIALFSSPLLKSLSQQKYQYWETEDLEFVLSMNFLTHISSDSIVISDKPNPYGDYKNIIKKFLREAKSAQPIKGKQILFYTSNTRYLLSVKDYEWISDNPIKSKIKFWTSDLKTLKSIANDEFINSVHMFKDGKEMGMSRELIFQEVGLLKETPSVIIQL